MIDSLLSHLEAARRLGVPVRLELAPGGYAVLTLHRASNVDDPAALSGLLGAVEAIQEDLPVVFPVHPRTLTQIEAFGFGPRVQGMRNLNLCEPVRYLEFLGLTSQAELVLTDPGGLQEESTGVPCPPFARTPSAR